MNTQTKKTTVYLPERLHAQLIELAKEEKRSFNSEIIYALEQYVKKGEGRHAKSV